MLSRSIFNNATRSIFCNVIIRSIFIPLWFSLSGCACSCSGRVWWAGGWRRCRTSPRARLSASESPLCLTHPHSQSPTLALCWMQIVPSAVACCLGYLSVTAAEYVSHSCQFVFVVVLLYRYVGEIISDAEADVRENDSYLFSLDNKVLTTTLPPACQTVTKTSHHTQTSPDHRL